jgi:glutamate formiminotransferase / formiminotetrahydrofolate cyclodeaminase
MPTQLIECIPNFSEARRPEVIDWIVAAIQSVDDVKLLDRSSDLDHNRTVLTFAGSPFAGRKPLPRIVSRNIGTHN